MIGLNEDQIRKWRKTDWWAEVEEEITVEISKRNNAKVARAYELALDNLTQRLQEGDPQVDKEGRISFTPVRARDSVIAADRLYSQLRLNAGLSNSSRGQAESLASLAQAFAQIAGKSRVYEGEWEVGPIPGQGGGANSISHQGRGGPSRNVDGDPDA